MPNDFFAKRITSVVVGVAGRGRIPSRAGKGVN